MASAAREPITGSGGGAPNEVQGQTPWLEGQGGKPPVAESFEAFVRLKEGLKRRCQYAKTV